MQNSSENLKSSDDRPSKSFFDMIEEKYLIRWAALLICVIFWTVVWRLL
ncbi:hypothetical protein [Phyllobacterium lublinensis]|nr:hypothetical protein [Phyllobacterium sp. 2063]MBZ9656843.1 hypothetical protein [Phyllobacterium sp. 2063]